MIEMETEPWEIEEKLAPSLSDIQQSCFSFLCEPCAIKSMSETIETIVAIALSCLVNFNLNSFRLRYCIVIKENSG